MVEPRNPFRSNDDATQATVSIYGGPPSPTLWIEIEDPSGRENAAIIMSAAEARRFAVRIAALADIAQDQAKFAAAVAEDRAELAALHG